MSSIPLTPVQHRHLYDINTSNPHLDNISRMWIVPPDLDFQAIQQVTRSILLCHDALRLRFICDKSLHWKQVIGDPEDTPAHRVDLSALPAIEQKEALRREAAKWHASLNVSEGPLFRVVYFDFGAFQPGRVLLICHHIIIDPRSLDILLQDLVAAYQQIKQGEEIHLRKPGTSFSAWAERLKAFTDSIEMQQELENYWLKLPWEKIIPLPIDYPDGGWHNNTRATAHTVSLSLSAEETQVLLLAATPTMPILTILLATLAFTTREWSGSPILYAMAMNHGRTLFHDMNMIRTVGPITCAKYFFLDITEASTITDLLPVVCSQIDNIPNQGVGYGFLKHLGNEQVVEKLSRIPPCEFAINYFGVQENVQPSLPIDNESPHTTLDPQSKRPQIVGLSMVINEGRLEMTWSYSTNLHRPSTINQFIQWYRENLGKITSQA